VNGEGPPEDFTAFYLATFPRVRRSLALSLGEPELAEDAAAEAMARALARWPSVRRHASPSAWVHTVALNLVRSTLRRRRLERSWLARQREQHAQPPAEPDDALWLAVAALPPRTRTAVALRYVADLTEAQVAEAMGITRGAVASLLHEARRRLAEGLADQRADPTFERTLP
jgi:RNA polymerase sigma factor (sigma-70 family)